MAFLSGFIGQHHTRGHKKVLKSPKIAVGPREPPRDITLGHKGLIDMSDKLWSGPVSNYFKENNLGSKRNLVTLKSNTQMLC